MTDGKTVSKELYFHMEECALGWLALLGTAQGLRRISLHRRLKRPWPGSAQRWGRRLRTPTRSPTHWPPSARILPGKSMRWNESSWTWGRRRRFLARLGKLAGAFPPAKPGRIVGWPRRPAIPGHPGPRGQAMAKNPLPLVVPCHRVIGSGGGLHGYGAGGLGVKARLLEMEQLAVGKHQPTLSAIMTAS